jgi:aryl-alcohol dehydrogenase-like predicted oxidoreductase
MTMTASPIVFGGNVFGWTADEATSHALLDAYVDAGGTMIDTADAYSAWAPGNSGGESEAIIGSWLAKGGRRDALAIATKVAKLPSRRGLSRANILAACDDSLRRLGTDHIDLYYAHEDDPSVPMEETLGAFAELVQAGKVRAIGASNFTPERLAQALDLAEAMRVPGYTAYQGHYNLVERAAYEGPMRDLVASRGLAFFPYYGLARGFLAGAYASADSVVDSPRAEGAKAYFTPMGQAVLATLREIAEDRGAPVAAVALAWLAAQPTVTGALASARSLAQWAELAVAMTLELSPAELAALDAASR